MQDTITPLTDKQTLIQTGLYLRGKLIWIVSGIVHDTGEVDLRITDATGYPASWAMSDQNLETYRSMIKRIHSESIQ